MARKPRLNLVGIPQHIIQRGNNRQACFASDDEYLEYLENMKECLFLYDYCLMMEYHTVTNST